MSNIEPLVKFTAIIWAPADYFTRETDLEEVAWEADRGDCYCSKLEAELIDHPKSDPDWDGTEFFDLPGDHCG